MYWKVTANFKRKHPTTFILESSSRWLIMDAPDAEIVKTTLAEQLVSEEQVIGTVVFDVQGPRETVSSF